jgi:quercetin dioxygenase-like cupin family protein
MTPPLELRLWEDRLAPHVTAASPAGLANRVVYVVEGDATVGGEPLTANHARHVAGRLDIRAGATGARCWRWELIRGPRESALTMASGPTSATPISRLVFLEPLALDPAARYLMRCDRVDFPLGGIAYTHTHQGPGIRCLLRGALRVDTRGKTTPLRPGGAWFEEGPEPVYAEASSDELTSFVRVMILPASLIGKSSIRYVNPEDQARPKTQTYTVFVDQPIDLDE